MTINVTVFFDIVMPTVAIIGMKFMIVLEACHELPKYYIKIRTTASPTADMETRVPMQYLITSYFAASNWALNA